MRFQSLALGVLVAACGAAPALALDVVFSGDVSDTCSIAIGTPGHLVLSLDGTIFGSDQAGGIPALVNIVSLGLNHITVGAPTRTDEADDYDPSGEILKVGYAGGSGLSSVSRAIATGSSSFAVGLLGVLTTLTVNNQIVNPNGFAQGHYETTTVITCS